jgi:hypothetical protein
VGKEQMYGAWRHASGVWVAVATNCWIHFKAPPKLWALAVLCSGSTLMDVWGASGTDAHAVGSGGKGLHYDGAMWTVVSLPTTADLHALWGANASNVYAVGKGGTVLRNDGVTWGTKPIQGPFGTNDLTDVWGSGADRIYVVGPNTKVYRYGR